MAYLYKLLSQDMTSHGGMKWEIGVPNFAKNMAVADTKLCTDDVLHCYSDPELAVILNPIHAKISNPRLFRIRTSAIVANDGTKIGTKKQTLLKELPLPTIPMHTKVIFAILCAMEVCKEERFSLWAEKYLSGIDRSYAAADAAAYANAAKAAYADASAANAAYAAANAAHAAAYAAAYAAHAAAYAAAYAAHAAANATKQNEKISLIQLVQKSKNY